PQSPSSTGPALDQGRGASEGTALIVGPMNVGKTALFNRLAGARAVTANYPGTSVEISTGSIMVGGRRFKLVDTPGIGGIYSVSDEERVTQELLLREPPDLVLLVADAKNLRRSLVIALQIAGFGVPMAMAVNMVDEARKRGIRVDEEVLSERLGIPVVSTVAVEGHGIRALRAALEEARVPMAMAEQAPEVEAALARFAALTAGLTLPKRPLGVMLLVEDDVAQAHLASRLGIERMSSIEAELRELRKDLVRPADVLVNEAFIEAAEAIAAGARVDVETRGTSFSESVGRWSLRLSSGVPMALLVLAGLYLLVGVVGADYLVGLAEGRLFGELLVPASKGWLDSLGWSWLTELLVGRFGLLSVGLSLAFGIAVPVLATFFVALGFLEESGYLPRLAVLFDRALRRVGLAGNAVMPLVLGFSCITMALLTARVLRTRKQQLIASALLVLGIPCAPLFGVGLALLAKMTIWAWILLWGWLALQLLLVGWLASIVLPGAEPDFVLELPPMRMPRIRTVLWNTLLRIKWFMAEAIPLFLLATFVLFLLDQLGLVAGLERVSRPILLGLGLPEESVQIFLMTLIRRESGAAHLKQLFDQGAVLHSQALALLLMVFMIPCVNAWVVLLKERGMRATLALLALAVPLMFLVGGGMNALIRLLGVPI
ncbi:MAG: ferrous iron transport protein B, partial [Polyangia bacterium]|nr:ferrous iron transport protein B [Polyangia bacterium]